MSIRLRCRSAESPLKDLCLKELSASRRLKVVEISLPFMCLDAETSIMPILPRSVEHFILRDVLIDEYELAIPFLHEIVMVKRRRLTRLTHLEVYRAIGKNRKKRRMFERFRFHKADWDSLLLTDSSSLTSASHQIYKHNKPFQLQHLRRRSSLRA